jgi:hypothetical protein
VYYCDVVVTQINYPNLNKQDSIEQARSRSHEEGLVQIFMLDDIKFEGGDWSYLGCAMVNRIKQSR